MTGRRESTEPSDPLGAWVRATWHRAVAYAASLLRVRDQAEDVAHDCYCALLRKADRYDLPRDDMKLLFTALTRACLKRNTRRRPSLRLYQDGPGGERVVREVVDPAAAEPVRVLLDRELEQAIGAGLARLPVPQRAALELKSLGHSLDDIAASLGVSPTNAGVLVHRARQALARHLAPYLEEKTG